MDWISQPEAWVALLTLTFLEVVLGIDNIVFISIMTGKLPVEQQKKARRVALGAGTSQGPRRGGEPSCPLVGEDRGGGYRASTVPHNHCPISRAAS